MSFVDVFGSNTVPPSEYKYAEYALTENETLVWPENYSGEVGLLSASIIDFSTDVVGISLTLPPANEVSVGRDILVLNSGSQDIEFLRDGGASLFVLAPGEVKYTYIIDNSSEAGLWQVFTFGTGTSSVDASLLAGAGLQAFAGLLRQNLVVDSRNSNYTVVLGDRSKIIDIITGSVIVALPDTASAVNGFFVSIRNSSSGSISVDAFNSQTIDGTLIKTLSPGEAATFHSNGNNWVTTGYGRDIAFTFSEFVVDASLTTVTLTSADVSGRMIRVAGIASDDVVVTLPAIDNIYFVSIESGVGVHSVTFTTGLGSTIELFANQQTSLYSDGTNIVTAINTAVASSLQLGDGSPEAPSLFFDSEHDLGVYKVGPGLIGFASGGLEVAVIGPDGLVALDDHLNDLDNPHVVTKAQVGLSEVDNTSDADKPISTATQAALDLKAPIDSPVFTGVPEAPTAAPGTDTTQIATTEFVQERFETLPFADFVTDTFISDGVETNFTLSSDPIDIDNLDVDFDGVQQTALVDFTLSGTTLTIAEPVEAGIEIVARYGISMPLGSIDATGVTYTFSSVNAVQRTQQLKNEETVSVLDFGAVGNGVADDTLAFTNALNSSAVVVTVPYKPLGYCLTNIEIPEGKALIGEDTGYLRLGVPGGIGNYNGTSATCTWIKAIGTVGTALIVVNRQVMIKNLLFADPRQKTQLDSPTEAWNTVQDCIEMGVDASGRRACNGLFLENLGFVGFNIFVRQARNAAAELPTGANSFIFRNLVGCPVDIAIEIALSRQTSYIEGCSFTTNCAVSYQTGTTAQRQAFAYKIASQSICYRFGVVDGIKLVACQSNNVAYGVVFDRDVYLGDENNTGSFQWIGGEIDGCFRAFTFRRDGPNLIGSIIMGGTSTAGIYKSAAVFGEEGLPATITFDGVNVGGPAGNAYALTVCGSFMTGGGAGSGTDITDSEVTGPGTRTGHRFLVQYLNGSEQTRVTMTGIRTIVNAIKSAGAAATNILQIQSSLFAGSSLNMARASTTAPFTFEGDTAGSAFELIGGTGLRQALFVGLTNGVQMRCEGSVTMHADFSGTNQRAQLRADGVFDLVTGNSLKISVAKTPASAADTGEAGMVAWDSNFIYVCVAANTWKRVPIASW